MIKFNEVILSDRELIQSYTLRGHSQNCDLSFANLISWRFLYDTQYAVVDGFLVFRFYVGRHLAYMGPFAPEAPVVAPDGGAESTGNHVESCAHEADEEAPRRDDRAVKVVNEMRADAIAMGHPFLMIGTSREMADRVEECMPGEFCIKPERDFFDYIYSREKLESLSGKHLQSKRNHCNKFRTLYPDYEYRPLSRDMIPECLRLEESWREQTKDSVTDEERENLYEELRSMTRAFLYWDHLDCFGGTIYVDGRLVAFTYGCPINQDTFDVCVEKADINYEGAFSIINQEFVRHLPPQYVHINREEDLGEEGLRRAKLSYKPELLLEKFSIMEKEPLAQFADHDRIKRETMALWRDTFHDSEEFVQLYFNKVYQTDYNVVCQLQGHVAGALQAIPMTLRLGSQEASAAYISGVSVQAGMRRQNIGTSLMRQAHNTLYDRRVVFACLIPAEEWLFTWYASCGYSPCIDAVAGPEGMDRMNFATFDVWQRSQPNVLLHTELGFSTAVEDLRQCGDSQSVPAAGMIRVIDAEAALAIYARLHPDYTGNLRVYADRDIANNNTYYALAGGHVHKTDRPLPHAQALTLAQLSLFIFKDMRPVMTLMMN